MAKIKSTKSKKVVSKTKPARAKSAPPKAKTAPLKKGKKVAVAAISPKKNAVSTPKKISRTTSVAEVSVKTSSNQNVKSSSKQKVKLSPREEKIQEIKRKLLRQREALLNEAETALNELPGQTMFPDLGDQATAETDRNFMLRLRGREQRLLKKIDEAIDRIESGIFGICDDCGNEISVKRLEARPVTTMCIECKTLQEEEERMREQ
jgi:DnaK suppressor protein